MAQPKFDVFPQIVRIRRLEAFRVIEQDKGYVNATMTKAETAPAYESNVRMRVCNLIPDELRTEIQIADADLDFFRSYHQASPLH
ncbi:MAG: hypothetical protein A2201_14005 [Alicyclobacillus sp. RIFOXYA1_FULL_53_8]|nr:MAG: hypothetical protein A2201_14005 [Alicyclobacillus sp. RIFOXYA1_FULL_53_8]